MMKRKFEINWVISGNSIKISCKCLQFRKNCKRVCQPAKRVYGLKPVSRVQIPPSPPEMQIRQWVAENLQPTVFVVMSRERTRPGIPLTAMEVLPCPSVPDVAFLPIPSTSAISAVMSAVTATRPRAILELVAQAKAPAAKLSLPFPMDSAGSARKANTGRCRKELFYENSLCQLVWPLYSRRY